MHGAYVTALHLAGSAPHGGGSAGGAAIAVTIVSCLFAFVVVLALALTRPPGRRDGEEGDSGPGGGGGGPGDKRPEGPDPAGGDPTWWPEFERQFADHVTSTIPA
jgi:hypothetical protein